MRTLERRTCVQPSRVSAPSTKTLRQENAVSLKDLPGALTAWRVAHVQQSHRPFSLRREIALCEVRSEGAGIWSAGHSSAVDPYPFWRRAKAMAQSWNWT